MMSIIKKTLLSDSLMTTSITIKILWYLIWKMCNRAVTEPRAISSIIMTIQVKSLFVLLYSRKKNQNPLEINVSSGDFQL